MPLLLCKRTYTSCTPPPMSWPPFFFFSLPISQRRGIGSSLHSTKGRPRKIELPGKSRAPSIFHYFFLLPPPPLCILHFFSRATFHLSYTLLPSRFKSSRGTHYAPVTAISLHPCTLFFYFSSRGNFIDSNQNNEKRTMIEGEKAVRNGMRGG